MKWFIRILIAILVLVAATAGYLRYNHDSMQGKISLQHDTTVIGPFPMTNSLITAANGISFLVDTGSDLSMITPGTLQKLREMGYRVDSVYCPVVWRGSYNLLHFTTKRYIVDIPLGSWNIATDSIGLPYPEFSKEVVNVVRNMNFMPAIRNVDVIGLDLLRRYAVEYDAETQSLTFHKKRPEGYENLVKLGTRRGMLDLLGTGRRLTMPIEVAGRENDFILDTGLDFVHLKLPAADSIYSRNELDMRAVVNKRGEILRTALAQDEWLRVGMRSGVARVSYYDGSVNEYAVDPFRFTRQDVLLDFINGELALRPHYDFPEGVRDEYKPVSDTLQRRAMEAEEPARAQ